MAKLLNGELDTPENSAREFRQELAEHRNCVADVASALAKKFSILARFHHYYHRDRERDENLKSAHEMREAEKYLRKPIL